jgi:hypothetical protein
MRSDVWKESTVTAGGRGVFRLLAVGTVLLGLFLMHGSPATAGDCHGAMRMSAPAHEGHDAVAMTSSDVPPEAVETADASGAHGPLCVSTTARDHPMPPSAGLASILILAVLAAWSSDRPLSHGWTRRRGPPTRGRDLLLRVCVART